MSKLDIQGRGDPTDPQALQLGPPNSTWLPILDQIDQTAKNENIATEVMVGLLTLLCIILISIVVYLCYSRGISSLSRYVM